MTCGEFSDAYVRYNLMRYQCDEEMPEGIGELMLAHREACEDCNLWASSVRARKDAIDRAADFVPHGTVEIYPEDCIDYDEEEEW